MTTDDKIIVSNKAALVAKYGAKGFARIATGLKALVVADKARGIKTAVIYLDNAAAMKKVGGKAVTSPGDRRAAKAAIDAVFKKRQPDYLMILGAIDVVPHQDLTNPAHDPADPEADPDRYAYGDLPYACDAPYGRDPAKFVGPTRVVSRLPDLTGATEPSHLLALLRTAVRHKPRKPADYVKYFGLSAAVWEGSSKLSLENVTGNADALLLSPPKGPKHSPSALAARVHFINCHGTVAAPEFYGQRGNSYPVSLSTTTLDGAVADGTVAAVECCYGAELYDSETLGLDMPICQSYLRQGAYGYLGSTTIAYGPADSNGAADWICQFFLLNILGGASVGRAALMARQQFVQQCQQLDPVDLKTLAQFCVYGDPAAHPVAAGKSGEAADSKTSEETARFRRSERRAKLAETGHFLQRTKPTASKPVRGARTPAKARSALATIARKGGLPRGSKFVAFKVKGAKPTPRGSAAKVASAPARYYLSIGKPSTKGPKGEWLVAVVAKEVNGRIIDYCIYHER